MPGMRTLEDNIAKLEAANADTRAVVREAHETIKTARLVLKELREEHNRWAEGVKKEVDAALERQVAAGLETFMGTIQEQTQSAHDRVIKEFDKLQNIMLYGNEHGKGSSLVTDWVRRCVRDEMTAVAKGKRNI